MEVVGPDAPDDAAEGVPGRIGQSLLGKGGDLVAGQLLLRFSTTAPTRGSPAHPASAIAALTAAPATQRTDPDVAPPVIDTWVSSSAAEVPGRQRSRVDDAPPEHVDGVIRRAGQLSVTDRTQLADEVGDHPDDADEVATRQLHRAQ